MTKRIAQTTKLATDSLVSERCPRSRIQQRIPRSGGAHIDSVEALRYKPGSIPHGVIGSVQWPNPSDRTMDLGSTQPLTE